MVTTRQAVQSAQYWQSQAYAAQADGYALGRAHARREDALRAYHAAAVTVARRRADRMAAMRAMAVAAMQNGDL